jgi:hypothetical protein
VSVLSHAREGARRYRALLALPGARTPVILSAAGSMPIGMFGLGILVLARDAYAMVSIVFEVAVVTAPALVAGVHAGPAADPRRGVSGGIGRPAAESAINRSRRRCLVSCFLALMTQYVAVRR